MLKITRRAGVLILVAALAAACAPKQPDPTIAQVTITAAADANPDPSGRPSPSVIFVYALTPDAPFASGPYEVLTGGELGELGASMKRLDRMIIVPGKSETKEYKLIDGTAGIGVAVGYRQIGTAKWRDQAPVKANATTPLTVSIGSNEVKVE